AAAKTFSAGQSGCFSHHINGWSLYARLPHHGGNCQRIRAADLGDDAGGHLLSDGPLSADWYRQTVRPLRAFPSSTRCTECDACVAPVWAATGSRAETLERVFAQMGYSPIEGDSLQRIQGARSGQESSTTDAHARRRGVQSQSWDSTPLLRDEGAGPHRAAPKSE